MALLLKLVPDITNVVLREWIDWKDIVHFDTSLCNKKLREDYFTYLRSNMKISFGIMLWKGFCEDQPLILLRAINLWVSYRRIRIKNLTLSSEIFENIVHDTSIDLPTEVSSLTITDIPQLSAEENDIWLVSLYKFPSLKELRFVSDCTDQFETEEFQIKIIRSCIPHITSLISLTLHHVVLGYESTKILAESIPCIERLSLVNQFDEPDILTALFVDNHLQNLKSIRLLTKLGRQPEWSEQQLITLRKHRRLDHLNGLFVDPHTLKSLSCIAPYVHYTDSIMFDCITPYNMGLFEELARSYCHMKRLSLKLQFVLPDLAHICLQELSIHVFPQWKNLQYLSIILNSDMFVQISELLGTIPQETRYLRTLRFHKLPKLQSTQKQQALSFSPLLQMSITEQCSRWSQFWMDMLKNNIYLNHLDISKLPVDLDVSTQHGQNLITLILNDITVGLPSSYQSKILHSIGHILQFQKLICLHIEDDHITDDVARDFFIALSQQAESKLLTVKKLVLLSKALTNQVLQTLLYLPESFHRQLFFLMINGEYGNLLHSQLLLRVSKLYCAPFGSLKYFSIVVSIDETVHLRFLPQQNAFWKKQLSEEGINEYAVPTIHPYHILRNLKIRSHHDQNVIQFPFLPKEDTIDLHYSDVANR